MVVLPMVLPMVVLMARRKRMTDNPSRRKTQERPVAVMGGTVVVLVLAVSLIIVNMFYDITDLFSFVGLMIVFYVFGMLDDNIGLSWKFKLCLQVVAILLLFFGSNYGVHSLYSLFPDREFPLWLSLVVTLVVGLLLFNAVNFADGIDGLATGQAVLTALVMGHWNLLHAFVVQSILSYAMLGVLLSFFMYNVFSTRYKIYLGDSGSLVLGLFVYILVCPEYAGTMTGDMLVDHYYVSFVVTLLSAMIFDLVRVVLWRLVCGGSPFRPDRSHLHHVYVDLGMSHFMATMTILLTNVVALLFWHATALRGLSQLAQLLLVLGFCALLYWGPFFYVTYLRAHRMQHYRRLSMRVRCVNKGFVAVHDFIRRIIDGIHFPRISHEIE